MYTLIGQQGICGGILMEVKVTSNAAKELKKKLSEKENALDVRVYITGIG
jgi:Fe-S cluster assembly iron-binding protein IscA